MICCYDYSRRGERHACVVQRIKPERSRRARDPSRPWKKNPAISRAPPRGRLRETTNPRSLPSRRHTSPRSAMSAAGAAMDADDPPSCSASADSGGFEFAAKSAQLAREDARLQVEVRGRHLILVRRAGRVLAMDATCYHMGAPLLHGDIEDIPGHGSCITCPWHHYQISMSTGERLYQDMDHQTCTLPKKQRVPRRRPRPTAKFASDSAAAGNPRARPRDETPAAPRTPQIRMGERQVRVQTPAAVATVERRRAGRGALPRSGHVFGRAGAPGGVGLSGPRYPGAGSGLHPGLRGRGVGEMVAQSMKGGDGKAPWAMAPGGGVATRSALGSGAAAPPPSFRGPARPNRGATRLARETLPSLPSPPPLREDEKETDAIAEDDEQRRRLRLRQFAKPPTVA